MPVYLDEADISKVRFTNQVGDPAEPPPVGYVYIYIKNGQLWYMADDGVAVGPLIEDTDTTLALASQAEAEAGADNTKAMTPLRTAQAIAALETGDPNPAIASQAEAEAGADNVDMMTALRTAQAIAALETGEPNPAIASQAEAEAGTDNVDMMTALRTAQAIVALQRGLASQAEAEAGAENAKDMTPLRVLQAINALLPSANTAGLMLAEQGGNPTTPGNGFGKLYAKSDGLYFIDDAGVVIGPLTFSGGLTDYSSISTVVGWSSTTSKSIFYRKIGKIVHVFFEIKGTSNSTAVTFTTPSALSGTSNLSVLIRHQNNGGTHGTGLLVMSGSTVTCYTSLSAGAWTNSGSKEIFGQFFYNEA